MFTIVRQSVVCKIQVPVVNVKHRGQILDKIMKMCIGTTESSFIEGSSTSVEEFLWNVKEIVIL
jgi:hypothetical protein